MRAQLVGAHAARGAATNGGAGLRRTIGDRLGSDHCATRLRRTGRRAVDFSRSRRRADLPTLDVNQDNIDTTRPDRFADRVSGATVQVMPVDLEQQILIVLRGMKAGDRPATIGDLSRRLGVSSQVIAGCIRQMVARGSAEPSMIQVKGVQTLHGLLGQPVQPVQPVV
jgi:hypothetical protein